MKKRTLLVSAFIVVALLLTVAVVGSIFVYSMEKKEKETTLLQSTKKDNDQPNLKFDEMTEYQIPVDDKTLGLRKDTHFEIDEDMDVDLRVDFSMVNSPMVINNIIAVEASNYGEKVTYSEDYVVISCSSDKDESFVPGLFVSEINGRKEYRNGESEDIIGIPVDTLLMIDAKEIAKNTYKYRFAGDYNARYKMFAVCIASNMSCKKISKASDEDIIVNIKNSKKGDLPGVLY